jgi:hypothetical protein
MAHWACGFDLATVRPPCSTLPSSAVRADDCADAFSGYFELTTALFILIFRNRAMNSCSRDDRNCGRKPSFQSPHTQRILAEKLDRFREARCAS